MSLAAPHPDTRPELYAGWDAAVVDDLRAHFENPCVGTRLVHVDPRARFWELRLAPGERLAFHRHVSDYVWTCITGGAARSHYGDGSIVDVEYAPGDTQALAFGAGESMIHDLVNTGPADLVFTTVELLQGGANAPLPLPAGIGPA